MLLKNLLLSVKNLQSLTRIISSESFLTIQTKNYARWSSRKHVAIVNENELFDVNIENTSSESKSYKTEKKTKFQANRYKNIENKENIKRDLKKVSFEIEENKENNKKKLEEEITFEIPENEKNNKRKPKEFSKEVTFEISENKKNNKKKQKVPFEITDENSNKSENSTQVYTKLYENDKFLSSLMMNLKSKKQRKQKDLILLEGKRLIQDAIEAGFSPETIIFSRWDDVKEIPVSNSLTKLYKVPYRSIQLWSTLTNSPGIMGIFKRPEAIKISESSLPITIICDNIRDPGNMGSILRAAAGAGCEKVILTKGCVDFWDSKVLRSASGAHFRLSVYASQNWDDIKLLIHDDAHIYVADNNIDNFIENHEAVEDEENPDITLNNDNKRNQKVALMKMQNLPVMPYYAVDYTKNEVILIVGGETEGLSAESYALIKEREGIRVNIPLNDGIDSLNAGMALGVVVFEVKRQFLFLEKKLQKLTQ